MFSLAYSNDISHIVLNWLNTYVLVKDNLIQLIIISILLTISCLIKKTFSLSLENIFLDKDDHFTFLNLKKIDRLIKKLTFPLAFTLLLWFYTILAANYNLPYHLSYIFMEIIFAWILIKLISSFFKSNFIVRLFSLIVLLIVTLNILNIYKRTINLLDGIAFSTGNFRLSLLLIIQAGLLLSAFLWIASRLSVYIEEKIKDIDSLTPSIQVLFSKFIRFILFSIAVIISLNSLGIDLTAFTVLSGAIGVGIGFGLQKIVSNFISGIIILIDKSIKPGDIVEIGDTYGWISSLNARFVSVITPSGEEYLIPNEDFITKQVVNLSYSDKRIRLEVPIDISYNSDVEKAISLVKKAPTNIDRIATTPEPNCLLTGFGDSSVKLELRFWVEDLDSGFASVKSDVLLAIWKTFQENNIEIPYPQRDLHLRSVSKSVSHNPHTEENAVED